MQRTNIKKYLQDIFNDRLGTNNIEPVLQQACSAYKIGSLRDFSISAYGFQDVNVRMVTTRGTYFVKLFSRDKSRAEIANYVKLMQVVHQSGVAYPAIYENPQGFTYTITVDGKNISLCLQRYIEGANFHQAKKAPTRNDLKQIAIQAAMINVLDFRPAFVELDTWATLRFPEMFQVKKEALTHDELSLIEPLLKDFKRVPVSSLPHSLVHGDIIRTNVIKDSKGKIWIIDLGAATYQPRVVELAVMAHDLFLDLESVKNTRKLRIFMLTQYQTVTKLTSMELESLPTLIHVTHAMYLMSAAFMERTLGQSNPEITFWFQRSKKALSSIEQHVF